MGAERHAAPRELKPKEREARCNITIVKSKVTKTKDVFGLKK
jgi:hypothetical protein